MERVKNSLFLTVAVALGVVVVASAFTNNPAFAAINFKSGPNCQIFGQNQLECSGRVTGLGNTATASLTATATVTQGCINRGAQGQEPSGLQRTTTTVSAVEPLAVRNGGANFDLKTTAISPTISCPDHMTPVVVCVTYSNIQVTISSSTGSRTEPGNPSTVSSC